MRNFIVTVNGTKYEVGVEEVGTPSETSSPKRAVPLAAAEAAPTAAASKSGTELRSPFPGLVKELLVAEGAPVKKDQPILLMEAMKMDNDITAPCDGTVAFCVAKGATVETDTLLAVIS